MARRFRYAAMTVALAAALAFTGSALAQSVSLGVAGGVGGPAGRAAGRVSVAVLGAEVRGSRVDLGLAYDAAAGAAQLDFGVQANETFGPLGNVIGEGRLWLRTDAQAQASLGVRGVLGPVALGVRASAFTADPARFDPLALLGAERPDFGAAGFGLSLSASGRVGRTVILEADPELYLVPGGAALRATARVRLLRAIGRNELSVRAEGYLPPAGGTFDAALGVGFTWTRPRAPNLDGALYLGWSRGGLAPGGTATLAQQLGPVLASLQLAAEPYRLDVPPYRARLGLQAPLGPGTAHLDGAGALGPAGLSASLQLRYELPVRLTP